MKTKLYCLFIGLTLAASLHQAVAQGTAFTFQGRMNDGTNPANGNYDFAFQVYDAPTGVNSYGVINTNVAVGVTNGLFTVTLDFGNGVFTGPQRWLQTVVRSNGVVSFTSLFPRQPLLPTPYAIYAGASGVSSSVSNSAVTASSLNTIAAPASGQVLSYTGSGLSWITPSGGSLTLPYSGSASSSGSIFTLQNTGSGPAGVFQGNVGIGTTTPGAKLHIYGNGAPGAHIPSTEAVLASGDGYHDSFMSVYGDNAVTLDMWNGLYGEVSTYNYATGTALPLVLNSNGGNIGIGTITPAAKLDVVTSTSNGQAFRSINLLGGVYAELAVSDTLTADGFVFTNYIGVYGNGNVTSTLQNIEGSYAGYFDGNVSINGTVNAQGGIILAAPMHCPNAGPDTSTAIFTHKVANVVQSNKTYINNPICNGQPNAILLITQNWSAGDSVGNPKETGVYYDASVGQWTIFVVDGTAMPDGVAYNVMVMLP